MSNSTDSHSGFDPASYRPQPVAEALVVDRGETEPGARYVITTEQSPHAAVLSQDERRFWNLFDGERTVDDICVAYMEKNQSLAMSQIYVLINRLWQLRLLTENPRFQVGDTPEVALRADIGGPGNLRLQIPGTAVLTRLLGSLCQAARVTSFSAVVIILLLVLGGFGFTLGIDSRPLFNLIRPIHLGGLTLPVGYGGGLVVLLLIWLVAGLLRELVVAAVEGSLTGRYQNLQVGLVGWLPCFHHDRKWRVTLPYAKRLVAALAGMVAELLVAGFCAACVFNNTFGTWNELLYKVMMVLYVRALFHLAPYAASDFHSLMQEWLQLPKLRQKAVTFLHNKFIDALVDDDADFLREHVFFLLYVGVSLLWVVTVAQFGFYLIQEDTALKSEVLNLASGGGGANVPVILILLVFGLPVISAVLLALGWLAYFVWGLFARQPFFQRPNNAMVLGATAAAGATVGLRFVPVDLRVAGLTVGALALGVCGILVARTAYRLAGLTITGLPRVGLGLSMVAGGIAVLQQLNKAASEPISLLLMVVLIGLLPQALVTVARKQFLALLGDGKWRLPLVLLYLGAVLLVIGVLCHFELLAVPPQQRLSLAPQAELLGLALVALGLLTAHRHLNQAAVPSEVLILDGVAADSAAGLTAIYNNLRRNLRALLADKFGGAYVGAFGRAIDAKASPFAWQTDETFTETEPALARIRAVTTAVDDVVSAHFGHRFMDLVFNEVAARMNFECCLALDRALRQTRFALRDDFAVDAKTCLDTVDSISFFDELAQPDRHALARHMILHRIPSGRLIVRTGDPADACYIVLRGQARVEEVDLVGNNHIVKFLNAGEFFGEAALLENTVRGAHVRAASQCLLLVLYRADFDRLREIRPQVAERLVGQLEILHFLYHVQLFTDLPSALLRGALPSFRVRRFKDGDIVFNQGEEGSDFYLIREGHVDIVNQTDRGEERIARLGANDYFGEIALVRNVPRTAGARAVGETVALELHRAAAMELIEGSKLFATNLSRVGAQRLEAI